MKPRLASITGKLKDTVIPMTEGPVLIGRQTGANLRIRNAAVSRRHAMIEKEGESYVIADLDSRNGTFVNNIPVKRCELHHGDRVQIGESEFFFLIEENEESSQTSEIRLEEVPLLGGPAVRMTYSDALYVMARDLSAFLKISTTINALRSLDKLQRALLELLFEVVPARRGAILLTADHADAPDEFSSMFGLDRVAGPTQAVNVSRTIVRRVLNDKSAIMLAESDDTEDLKTVSLIAARSRSVLCVPLIVLERVLGVIYLDSDDPTTRFDENHLQLLTAVAAISAVAIENVRNFERLQNENARLMNDVDIEHNMVGESPLLQRVYQLISKVAPTDSTVLISGESGTGKELAARAIHRNSRRAGQTIYRCELRRARRVTTRERTVWHEKGAFTGASCKRRAGLNSPIPERSFWMKSETCRRGCRQSCCASFRNESSNGSVVTAR
jgi:hypothetical protein